MTRWAGPVLVALAGLAAGVLDENPVGWALLAGTVLLLVLGRLGRRVLGVVLGLLAVGMAAWALAADPRQTAGLVAGAVGLVGAALVVLTAGRVPERTSRYERRVELVGPDADPLQAWKAMDAGLDPTLEPGTESAARPPAESR